MSSQNKTTLSTDFEQYALRQINHTISRRTYACLQLESYNQLFTEIPELFHTFSLSTISAPDPHRIPVAGMVSQETRPFSLTFGNVYFDPPLKTMQSQSTTRLLPFEARIRGMTYSVAISVDVTLHNHDTNETVTHARVPFFEIPCMLRSRWCHLHNASQEQLIEAKECLADPGGYFIIDGAEKCIVSQMRMAYNNMMPIVKSKYEGVIVDYRTYSEETGKTSQVQAFMESGSVLFSLTFINSPISLAKLLLALDCRDVHQTLTDAGLLEPPYNLYTTSAVVEAMEIAVDSDCDCDDDCRCANDAACLWIGANARQQQPNDAAAIEYTRAKILRTSMFIHLGPSAPHRDRVAIVLRLVKTVIRANLPKDHEEYIPPVDKDNLANKRVETAGVLIREILRIHLSSLVKMVIPKDFAKSAFNGETIIDYIRKQGEKMTIDIVKRFKETIGWDNPARGGTNNFSRTGVSQALSRMNLPATCSQLLRLNQPIGKSAKVKEPRWVNSTHIGFIDPFDTPESGSAGLVLQICSMVRVTNNIPTVTVIDIISDILEKYPTGDGSVMVNGLILPKTVDDPEQVVRDFREYRVNGDISDEISVIYDPVEHAASFRSEDGRMQRMLWYLGDEEITDFISKILSRNMPLSHFISTGEIRWIDSVEICDLTVAMEPRDFSEGSFEYMEIHPSVLVGLCTQNSPYAEHMPSPRCCYQCSHYKQALSIATTVDTFRSDTTSHRMWYPSMRVVQTRQSTLIRLPTGQMCTVAICTWNGATQEDAIVMNRASVERGLFRVTTRKTHTCQEDPSHHIAFPTEEIRETMQTRRGYDYSKLGPDGIARVGEYVTENDVIISRYTSTTERKDGVIEESRKDSSLVVAKDKEGFVDTVHVARNGDGYLVVHVIIRKTRTPEPGDKWACYTPDHEILTERGWVNITEVTMEDRVASLMEDHTVEYCQPLEVGGYDYTGNIYGLETEDISLRVTPNHRMYTSSIYDGSGYTISRADEIFGNKRKFFKNSRGVTREYEEYPVCFAMSQTGEINDFILPVTDRLVPINEFLLFYGIWLVKGCTEPSETRSVKIYVNNRALVDTLDSLVGCLGLEKTVRGNRPVWSFDDPGFNALFTVKSLPVWAWYLSPGQSRVLIEGMFLGGLLDTGTPSQQLADDFQRLCLHAGYSANIIFSDVVWRFSVVTSHYQPTINQDDFWEPYSGRVYCCRVPGPGVVYVRRNGKGIWCGNTRTAQKGTVAYLEAPENLPFDPLTGSTPDILFNPHGLPSRMTLGYIYEMIQGRIHVLTGDTADATIFGKVSRPDTHDTIGNALEEELKELGMNSTGARQLIDGRTGMPIQADIMMGPMFYQRLKHLVSDKVHARAKGDMHMVSGQPVCGRERGGGLRLGKPFCPSGCASKPLVYSVVGDMIKLRGRLECEAA